MRKPNRGEMMIGAGLLAAGIAATELGGQDERASNHDRPATHESVVSNDPPPLDPMIKIHEQPIEQDGGTPKEYVEDAQEDPEEYHDEFAEKAPIREQAAAIRRALQSSFGDIPFSVQQPWQDADLHPYAQDAVDSSAYLKKQAKDGDCVLEYIEDSNQFVLEMVRAYSDEVHPEETLQSFPILEIQPEEDGTYTVTFQRYSFEVNVTRDELGAMVHAIVEVANADSLVSNNRTDLDKRAVIADAVVRLKQILADQSNPVVQQLHPLLEERVRFYQSYLDNPDNQ